MNSNAPLTHNKKEKWALSVCSVILLLFFLFGVYNEIKHLEMVARISKNGVTSNAVVINKDTIYHKFISTYIIYYEFKINKEENAIRFQSFSTVKEYIYDNKKKGDICLITYNQINPVESIYGDIVNIKMLDFFKYNWLHYTLIVFGVLTSSMLILFLLFDKIKHITNH